MCEDKNCCNCVYSSECNNWFVVQFVKPLVKAAVWENHNAAYPNQSIDRDSKQQNE